MENGRNGLGIETLHGSCLNNHFDLNLSMPKEVILYYSSVPGSVKVRKNEQS